MRNEKRSGREWYSVVLAVLAVSLAACDAFLDEPEEPKVDPWRSEFSEEAIRAAAYSDQRVPPGFFWDDLRPLYYENTVSTGMSGTVGHGEWRELCTDDYGQAKVWVELHLPDESLEERETEKFFEFKKPYDDRGFGPGHRYARVHRCAYLDPYVYDHFVRDPERGTFNHRPLTADTVKELGEYLWFLRYHDIGGAKVLLSSSDAFDDSIRHRLYLVGVGRGDYDLCDTIVVTRLTLTVDRLTGAMVEGSEHLGNVVGACH